MYSWVSWLPGPSTIYLLSLRVVKATWIVFTFNPKTTFASYYYIYSAHLVPCTRVLAYILTFLSLSINHLWMSKPLNLSLHAVKVTLPYQLLNAFKLGLLNYRKVGMQITYSNGLFITSWTPWGHPFAPLMYVISCWTCLHATAIYIKKIKIKMYEYHGI